MNKKFLLCAIAVLASVMPQSLWAYEWPGHDMWNFKAARFVDNVTRDNEIYLYNLGAAGDPQNVDRYFNTFGHWGVEGTLYEVGKPVYLQFKGTGGGLIDPYVKFKILTSPNTADETQNKVAWVYGQGNNDDNGLMCDRKDKFSETVSCETDWYFYRVNKNPKDNDYASST